MEIDDKTLVLTCPICGCDTMTCDEKLNAGNNIMYICALCGHKFTEEQIIDGNKAKVESVLESVCQDVLSKTKSEFQTTFVIK